MIASKILRGTGLALALAATGAFAADAGNAPKSGTPTAQETKPGMTQSNTSTGSPPSSTQAAGTQAAGTDATKPAMTFDQLDKNHDGSIDKSEAAAWPGLAGAFDKYDKARKGKLDRAEFDQAARELGSK